MLSLIHIYMKYDRNSFIVIILVCTFYFTDTHKKNEYALYKCLVFATHKLVIAVWLQKILVKPWGNMYRETAFILKWKEMYEAFILVTKFLNFLLVNLHVTLFVTVIQIQNNN